MLTWKRACGGVLVLSREEFPALPSRFRESGSLVSVSPSTPKATTSPSSVDAPVNHALPSPKLDWTLLTIPHLSASISKKIGLLGEIPHQLLTARQNVHPSLSYLQGTDS